MDLPANDLVKINKSILHLYAAAPIKYYTLHAAPGDAEIATHVTASN
jgi:hypothetical protein